MECSSFIQKIKSFQYCQWLAASVSVQNHVESLGNFKNKYKTKEEKVRNHPQKKEKKRGRWTDQTEKKKKKGKEEEEEEEQETEEEEAVASRCHP